MSNRSERGAIDILLVPLILATVLFLGAMIFAVWAYNGRQDYKTNSDAKIAAAVAVAQKQQTAIDNKAFAETEKQPFKTYTAPSAYGSVSLQYPKTWSAYVADTSNATPYVNGYFYPSAVPDVNDQDSVYALRVQVIQQSYSTSLQVYQSQIKTGAVTVSPYALPKVPNVVGSKIDGQIQQNKTGTMVMLPLRDKTLEIWTEASQFENDFNTNILPNASFSP